MRSGATRFALVRRHVAPALSVSIRSLAPKVYQDGRFPWPRHAAAEQGGQFWLAPVLPLLIEKLNKKFSPTRLMTPTPKITSTRKLMASRTVSALRGDLLRIAKKETRNIVHLFTIAMNICLRTGSTCRGASVACRQEASANRTEN